jgi:hypothetical protein
MIEDSKGVSRSSKLKKEWQYNDQKKKNNDFTQKTKERAILTLHKPRMNSGAPQE